jgi:2-C-methyl-D-erythritol 4-phosphate cytidylyltransferase / 2-C-methyl-D-erythritol 2,4-cyclodiphosphate synthase
MSKPLQTMPKIAAIIVAGGTASRFHGTTHKLLLPSSHRNILEQSLALFENHAKIDFLVLVVHPSLMSSIRSDSYTKLKGIVEGGTNRQESVFLGLKKVYALSSCELPDYILVHDAARPNASPQLIDRLLMELPSSHGAIPLIPLYDSLKCLENEQIKSIATSPSWYRTQTPQAFCFDLLYQSSIQAQQTKQIFRDEADLVIAFSPKARIKTIQGEFCNEKITSTDQVDYFRKLSNWEVKSGIGYDFHFFEKDKPLILGGLPIPFEYGLEGDSDGDVLTHAILDSLLGALSLGDMGSFFGIATPDLIGIQSILLFERLFRYVTSQGRTFHIHHIDASLVAKKPPLLPYIQSIRQNLASCINISQKSINIKATTDKGMDAAGSGKGIRVIALTTLSLAQEAINE